MGLENYHAIKTVLHEDKTWGFKKKQISEIEEFFAPYTDDPRLVLIPRFNGKYLSFRYCGLEVLQLSKKGCYRITIEEKQSKIRRRKSFKDFKKIDELDELKTLLNDTRQFLKKVLQDVNFFVNNEKKGRKIPGFSPEHWLESLILSDTEGGKQARQKIKISTDLNHVVSQVPVIKIPNPDGGIRRRCCHIDLVSCENNKIRIVELKKDNDLGKAIDELTDYSNWFLDKGKEFDPKRGNLIAMQNEHYLPKFSFDRKPENIRAIAVVQKNNNYDGSLKNLENSVPLEVVELPKGYDWLKNKNGNPFESSD